MTDPYGLTPEQREDAIEAVLNERAEVIVDGKGEWWLSLPEQAANLPDPEPESKGANESGSVSKSANPNAVTSEDCQGANQDRVKELWHPGTLADDPEPLDDSPGPVADVVPIKRAGTSKPKCGWCKKAFAPTRKGVAYCSRNCRQIANRASKKETE